VAVRRVAAAVAVDAGVLMCRRSAAVAVGTGLGRTVVAAGRFATGAASPSGRARVGARDGRELMRAVGAAVGAREVRRVAGVAVVADVGARDVRRVAAVVVVAVRAAGGTAGAGAREVRGAVRRASDVPARAGAAAVVAFGAGAGARLWRGRGASEVRGAGVRAAAAVAGGALARVVVVRAVTVGTAGSLSRLGARAPTPMARSDPLRVMPVAPVVRSARVPRPRTDLLRATPVAVAVARVERRRDDAAAGRRRSAAAGVAAMGAGFRSTASAQRSRSAGAGATLGRVADAGGFRRIVSGTLADAFAVRRGVASVDSAAVDADGTRRLRLVSSRVSADAERGNELRRRVEWERGGGIAVGAGPRRGRPCAPRCELAEAADAVDARDVPDTDDAAEADAEGGACRARGRSSSGIITSSSSTADRSSCASSADRSASVTMPVFVGARKLSSGAVVPIRLGRAVRISAPRSSVVSAFVGVSSTGTRGACRDARREWGVRIPRWASGVRSAQSIRSIRSLRAGVRALLGGVSWKLSESSSFSGSAPCVKMVDLWSAAWRSKSETDVCARSGVWCASACVSASGTTSGGVSSKSSASNSASDTLAFVKIVDCFRCRRLLSKSATEGCGRRGVACGAGTGADAFSSCSSSSRSWSAGSTDTDSTDSDICSCS
jgi:hypothetical protein